MKESRFTNPEKWILYGIPFIFLAGSALHFAYDLFWNSPAVGMFSAVNESTWEHMKLALFPNVLWWWLYYPVSRSNYGIQGDRWFRGALCSLCCSLLLIPVLFYGYTGAFGGGNVVCDILIFLVAVSAGQVLGLHVYKFSAGGSLVMPILCTVFFIALFLVFTFSTPKFPLFMDPVNGVYGIG